MARLRRVRLNSVDPLHPQLEEMSRAATEAALGAGFDLRAIELMRLRASQLNGCASCLKAHTAIALEAGEAPERIGMLTAWEESDYFTDAERAALELTEHITHVGELGMSDEDYTRITVALTEEQVAAAAWVAIVINASNRVWIMNRP